MKIEILLFDGIDELDVFGPFEVLTGAGLETRLVTVEPRDYVVSSGGARIAPHGELGDPDLVIVPGGGWDDRSGGPGARTEARRGVIADGAPAPARRRWPDRFDLHRRDGAGRGRAARPGARRPLTTTRSRSCAAFGVDVVDGSRVVDDGDIITSAGVTSGIDMALYLVEQELGAAAAEAQADEIELRWERAEIMR